MDLIVSRDAALERLKAVVERLGSRKAFCREASCTETELSHMLSGKRDITGKVASYISLRKVVAYLVIENKKDPKQVAYENRFQEWREQMGVPTHRIKDITQEPIK